MLISGEISLNEKEAELFRSVRSERIREQELYFSLYHKTKRYQGNGKDLMSAMSQAAQEEGLDAFASDISISLDDSELDSGFMSEDRDEICHLIFASWTDIATDSAKLPIITSDNRMILSDLSEKDVVGLLGSLEIKVRYRHNHDSPRLDEIAIYIDIAKKIVDLRKD